LGIISIRFTVLTKQKSISIFIYTVLIKVLAKLINSHREVNFWWEIIYF